MAVKINKENLVVLVWHNSTLKEEARIRTNSINLNFKVISLAEAQKMRRAISIEVSEKKETYTFITKTEKVTGHFGKLEEARIPFGRNGKDGCLCGVFDKTNLDHLTCMARIAGNILKERYIW